MYLNTYLLTLHLARRICIPSFNTSTIGHEYVLHLPQAARESLTNDTYECQPYTSIPYYSPRPGMMAMDRDALATHYPPTPNEPTIDYEYQPQTSDGLIIRQDTASVTLNQVTTTTDGSIATIPFITDAASWKRNYDYHGVTQHLYPTDLRLKEPSLLIVEHPINQIIDIYPHITAPDLLVLSRFHGLRPPWTAKIKELARLLSDHACTPQFKSNAPPTQTLGVHVESRQLVQRNSADNTRTFIDTRIIQRIAMLIF
ncbi:hypothetical protein DFP72DRAFT_846895 [Ephemerocybe angulata]|uniref:Uncharacterized protein n=1 Tax=Ephemerocybe angulata TaxID=980116 RepID=A0A8H6HZU5_9AGAR|nr:hypothetical protein DFP72DRAFT_846895 [Tulosesus angulatus]